MKTQKRLVQENAGKPIIFQSDFTLFRKNYHIEFTCKTTTKIFNLIFPILQKASAGKKLNPFDYVLLVSALWIVNHEKRKLAGICSISSCVHDNKLCACRMKIKDSICAHCYANTQQKIHNGLKEHNILNGLILRNILLPKTYLKGLLIIFPYLRIESFGDIENITQARNYIRIIKVFPKKRACIFSKNIGLWKQAFLSEGKPKNVTYIHSSLFVNKPDNIDLKKYPFVDHVFTVYTKKYIKQNNIIINCGGLSCMDCIKNKTGCYYPTSTKNEFHRREQVK